MIATWQKLELCKIRYYLDEYPDLYNFNHFEEILISPHLEKLPFLSNYSQVLFDYGKHLYSLKQNMVENDEDHSFIYCFNLLTEYRLLLLPGNLPSVKIPNSKNNANKRKGKFHITDDTYRRILMTGFETEMRKYNLHHIAKPSEQISQEIEDGVNEDWVKKCMEDIDKRYPKYPIQEKIRLLHNSYALQFPIVVESFTLPHIDFMIDRGLKVNEEQNYFKTSSGRPSFSFERECAETLFSLLVIDFVLEASYNSTKIESSQMNDVIRYEFIYDFLYYFKIYTTEINDINTTQKSDLIKSLIGKKPTRRQGNTKN